MVTKNAPAVFRRHPAGARRTGSGANHPGVRLREQPRSPADVHTVRAPVSHIGMNKSPTNARQLRPGIEPINPLLGRGRHRPYHSLASSRARPSHRSDRRAPDLAADRPSRKPSAQTARTNPAGRKPPARSAVAIRHKAHNATGARAAAPNMTVRPDSRSRLPTTTVPPPSRAWPGARHVPQCERRARPMY